MNNSNKIAAILVVNLIIFYVVDLIFGLIVGPVPEFLNASAEYASNYRNYFVEKEVAPGRKIFVVDRSVPVNVYYQNENFIPNSIKILAVGDSFTQGQGVKAQDTWVKKLETLSKEKKLYGINYGVSGLNIREIHEVFNYAIQQVFPSLVVYAYVLNDPILDPTVPVGMDIDSSDEYLYKDEGLYYDFINYRSTVFSKNRNPFLDILYKNSNMARYLIRSFERRDVSERTIQYYKDLHDPLKNMKGLNDSFAIIEEMKKTTEAKGGKFLVMIFPLFYNIEKNYPFENVHYYLQSELKKRKIDSLDLFPFYKGIKDSELWVHPIDQHPNDYAHGIAAHALWKWMELNHVN